ncbi:MFS transporter [Paenibacillus sp.]|uniref:MFS transporter n=1 Tax=Paenibacillus sp. TaxID=58172 RepID=UPI002D691315|nr:MFS transporter [Paenibacillus sp.]HZG86914.1 MFS transporter [Paenibacillus sp.]
MNGRPGNRFPLLLFAYVVGHLGDILYISLMVIHLKRTTGSTLLAALFPFVRVLAMFGSSFISPLLLERLPLVRLLALTRAGETAALLALAGAVALGVEAPAALLAFVLVISTLQGWTDPVVYALVARLTPAAGLARANATLATAREVGAIAAWGVGGVLAALLDPAWMLAGTALLFAAGFAAALRLAPAAAAAAGANAALEAARPAQPAAEPAAEPAAAPAQAAAPDAVPAKAPSRGEAIRLGWLELFRNPAVRAVVAMDLLEGVAISIFAGVFTLTFVEQRLGQEEAFWGFLNAAYFVGMIAGGALAARLSRQLSRRLPLALAFSSFGYGVGTLLYGATTSPAAALALVAALGLPCMIRETAQRTLLQLNVSERALPNALVAHGAINALAFALSLLLMGAAAERFGIQSIYYIGGALGLASAALGLALFARHRAAVKLPGEAGSASERA